MCKKIYTIITKCMPFLNCTKFKLEKKILKSFKLRRDFIPLHIQM